MQLSHPPQAVHTHIPGTGSAKATKHNGHRNSTLQHPQIQPEFWGSPSSRPTPQLQTLSCQRGWILFKSSSFADGKNQTQPVLPSTAQPQHPVRSRFRSIPKTSVNLVSVTKVTPANAKCYRKSNFSVDHTSCCPNI